MRHRLVHRFYARFPRARRIMMNLFAGLEMAMLRGHKDPGVLRLIARVRRERESLLSANEAFLLYSVARAQSKLDGAMAEVGVYQGCSAKLISLAAGGPELHLFDTFAGLPPPDAAEAGHLAATQYRGGLDSVRDYLRDQPRVSFHPGLFPDTAGPVADRRFSFVHLDVDLKSSTRAGLEFFHPRLVPGGVIMTHDYSYLCGVLEAFEEFAAEHGGRVVELSTSQAMLVRD